MNHSTLNVFKMRLALVGWYMTFRVTSCLPHFLDISVEKRDRLKRSEAEKASRKKSVFQKRRRDLSRLKWSPTKEPDLQKIGLYCRAMTFATADRCCTQGPLIIPMYQCYSHRWPKQQTAGYSRSLFSLFLSFQQSTVKIFTLKFSRWLDTNCGSLA